jgi:hypothetical protein
MQGTIHVEIGADHYSWCCVTSSGMSYTCLLLSEGHVPHKRHAEQVLVFAARPLIAQYIYSVIWPVNNLVMGTLWIDAYGEMRIMSHADKAEAVLHFKPYSIFGSHDVGFVEVRGIPTRRAFRFCFANVRGLDRHMLIAMSYRMFQGGVYTNKGKKVIDIDGYWNQHIRTKPAGAGMFSLADAEVSGPSQC